MINEVIIEDKPFTQFLSRSQIKAIILRLGFEIDEFYSGKSDIILISILDGSFIFMADLVRELHFPFEIRFVKLRSYNDMQSSGEIEYVLSLDEGIKDKHVLIVEDIIDSGLTIESFYNKVSKMNPASIKVCSLLSKPDSHNDIIPIDFLGLEIEPLFIVGYGLDLNGQGRHLPDLYKLKV